jgi:cytochrome c553
MKKVHYAIATFIIAIVVLGINSCEKGGCGESNISGFSQNESHNMGQNCMNCHKDGGEGEGCFNAAGTAYDGPNGNTLANCVVKLYTQPNGAGTLRATINGDAKGNFFTTESIDYNGGLYPVVTNGSATAFMPGSVSSGACNSCHGVNEAKIYVN